MTPEQLTHLTDEERRAWETCEAATPGPWADELDSDRKAERNNWREVYAGNRPVVVSDCYERYSAGETETVCGVKVNAPDAALIALSRTALPAALEALAEARARIAALEAGGTDNSHIYNAGPVPRVTRVAAKGSASGVGVGLTNCDSCRHDYKWPSDPAPRLCRLTRTHEATRMWSVANCDVDGAPIPGATGCPGYSPRGYATDATEEGDE